MMSTEQVSWRRDANNLRILAHIKAAQIFNRLSAMCLIDLSSSCLSLGIFSTRRYHFDKTFHFTDKSIRKVGYKKPRRKIKYFEVGVVVKRSLAIKPTKCPNLP